MEQKPTSLLYGHPLTEPIMDILFVPWKAHTCYYALYNPSYSRILICSRLWSIGGQMHGWRHHYKVFPSTVLKWRKVLRIKIIFYLTGQKISYIKVLPRHWTGSRSQKEKEKAVSLRKWSRKKFFSSLSRKSSETKPRTKLVLVSQEPLLYLEFKKTQQTKCFRD